MKSCEHIYGIARPYGSTSMSVYVVELAPCSLLLSSKMLFYHVLPKWTEKKGARYAAQFSMSADLDYLLSCPWWRSTQLKGTRSRPARSLLKKIKPNWRVETERKNPLKPRENKRSKNGREWNERGVSRNFCREKNEIQQDLQCKSFIYN